MDQEQTAVARFVRATADLVEAQESGWRAEAEHWRAAHDARLRDYDRLTLALSKRWGEEKMRNFLDVLGIGGGS